MFKIVRFPSKLKSFFDPLQNQFHYNHFKYFQMLVVLMAFSWGRRTITMLYRHLDGRHQPHRSRFNNFIGVGKRMDAVGWMDVGNIGKLHVIFSRRKADPKILGLVTDDPHLSAGQMIKTYDDRWSIEVFFKVSVQAVLAKQPTVFISDGVGIPSK